MTPADEANMGKMMWLIVVMSILAAGINASVAEGQTPVTMEEFTPEAHIWLARGVVAESGFRSHDDLLAISNVLARRTHMLQKKIPTATFEGMIREYMAGMGPARRGMSSRTRYIRELPYHMPATNKNLAILLEEEGWEGVIKAVPKPEGVPSSLRWGTYIMLWNAVLRDSRKWAFGQVSDKCSSARHWGGSMDAPSPRWRIVDCGDTLNIFYAVE